MFSILNRALSWAITTFGNTFCLRKRSRLIKALDDRFYVKFMQLEIGLLKQTRYRNLSLSFIFPTMYHLLIFDFSTMSYKSLKLFTFFGTPCIRSSFKIKSLRIGFSLLSW